MIITGTIYYSHLPALVTRPVKAHEIDAHIKITPIKIRAPYLSQSGPLIKRIKIVPSTEQMLDVQTSCGEIFNVSLILGRSGAMANQIKKAVKNPIHEQCTARI